MRSFLVILLVTTAALTEITQYTVSLKRNRTRPNSQTPSLYSFKCLPASRRSPGFTMDAQKLTTYPRLWRRWSVFDFDNDGWMDIYLVNSDLHGFFYSKTPIRNALYRNNHDGTFTDVTEKAGVACGKMGHFGMGAAAADFDGDGWSGFMSLTTVTTFCFTTTATAFHRCN